MYHEQGQRGAQRQVVGRAGRSGCDTTGTAGWPSVPSDVTNQQTVSVLREELAEHKPSVQQQGE